MDFWDNPWNWSGWAIGLASLLWGIWSHFRPRRTVIRVRVDQEPLGVESDADLQVVYKGKTVDTPTLVALKATHVSGPEIAEADFPLDGIVAIPDEDKILGPLAGSVDRGNHDVDGKRISLTPYLVRKSSTRSALFLANGLSSFETQLNVANTTRPTDAKTIRRIELAGVSLAGLCVILALVLTGWFEEDIGRGPVPVFFAGIGVVAALVAVVAQRWRQRS